MFNNVKEMFEYLDKLKSKVNEQILNRKKELNYLCECCKTEPIEIDYKANNFTEEYIENGNIKYTLNAHYFCKKCYIHVIKTDQLEKSIWMAEIDRDLF